MIKILQYLFLSFPATTPEPLGCSESLSTSILQLGFIQSLKVQVYHFPLSTSVSLSGQISHVGCVLSCQLLNIIISLVFNWIKWIKSPCLKSICDLQGSLGCLILGCAPCLATAILLQSSLFKYYEKRGERNYP